ncbi:NRDE family protein, partial [Paraburkholderia sp. SIMBA_049]
MCLIAFDWQPDAAAGPVFTLIANRDEFFRRTSAPLSWWEDVPGVLAGRDLEAGGTWLGVSRDGRFAALTNYRAPF